MEEEPVAGSNPSAAPRLIVPMSLQLVIPQRVALQQSSPPLHQPATILMEKKEFEQQNLLKSKCENCDCLIRGVHPKTMGKAEETVGENFSDLPDFCVPYRLNIPSR